LLLHSNSQFFSFFLYASIDMSGCTSFGVPPATPRRSSIRFDKSRPRREGVRSTTPLSPFGLSCGAISLCALKPRAARALTSHTCRCGSLLASTHSAIFEKLRRTRAARALTSQPCWVGSQCHFGKIDFVLI
jgi:hypothetical protein